LAKNLGKIDELKTAIDNSSYDLTMQNNLLKYAKEYLEILKNED